MYARDESEYYRAKMKAARRICNSHVKPRDLPSNREIRDQIQTFARLHEGKRREDNLRRMRVEALRVMRILRPFRPRLIGSTLTGHVRKGSDIDLHVFSDSVEAVAAALEDESMNFEIEHKRVRKQGTEQVFRHVHVQEMDGKHLGMGSAGTDFVKAFQTLKDLKFDRWISLEVFDFSPGGKKIAEASMTVLKEIEAKLT